MDDQQLSSSRRRGKFTPKAPPRQKSTKSLLPKTSINEEQADAAAAAQAKKLINKFNDNLRRQVPRAEKKSSVQVAFGPGATPLPSIRKFGVAKTENAVSSSNLEKSYSGDDDQNIGISSSSISKDDGAIVSSDAVDELPLKIKKDYVEPWDYNHSYYPTTLPLRRPYSGDPELLNESEFGEAARNLEYDENAINHASNFGLLEGCDEKSMILLQMPPTIPHFKRSATSAKGKERAESIKTSESTSSSSFKELSKGYMGKMLVYKSGAVKLKLGNVLYDVNPGSDFIFAQDVTAINTANKSCGTIGELGKRAVVTVNPDYMMDPVINLD